MRNRSKASIDIVVETAKSLGLEVLEVCRKTECYIVSMPEGEQMLIYPSGDGGTFYNVFPSPGIESVKTLQRIFAYAAKSEGKKIASPDVKDDVLSSGEERKKGTDEVSEFVSGTSDSVHGGDSSSGEVPDGELGRGQDIFSSKNIALPQSEAGSNEGEESAQSSDASSLSPDLSSKEEGKEEGESSASDCSKRKASEGESSSGDGSCLKSLECASPSRADVNVDAIVDGQASTMEGTGNRAPYPAPEDILRDILCEDGMPREEDTMLDKEPGEWSTLPIPSDAEEGEASEPEREVSPSLSFREIKKIMSRGQEVPSTHVRYSFGGVFADLESQGIPPRELVNRARRAFARLVSEYGEENEGPRWDYRKVSVRIASFQNWRVSDRKKESGRPAIAVLPDVSGSMESFANQVLEISKALMLLGVPGTEVITIVQSNAFPLELWVNGKKFKVFNYYDWDSGSEVLAWYEDIFRRWDVRVVILAADWDGAWLYNQIAENMNVKIYWLDVFLNDRVFPTLGKFPPEWGWGLHWSVTATKKIKYVYGCRNALDFVKGLELAIRKDKK